MKDDRMGIGLRTASQTLRANCRHLQALPVYRLVQTPK